MVMTCRCDDGCRARRGWPERWCEREGVADLKGLLLRQLCVELSCAERTARQPHVELTLASIQPALINFGQAIKCVGEPLPTCGHSTFAFAARVLLLSCLRAQSVTGRSSCGCTHTFAAQRALISNPFVAPCRRALWHPRRDAQGRGSDPLVPCSDHGQQVGWGGVVYARSHLAPAHTGNKQYVVTAHNTKHNLGS
jgi:hypothetical protein